MSKVFTIIICVLGIGLNTCFAQSKTETIDADLYFRFFDFFRYFDMEPKELKKLEHFMTTANLKKAGDDSLYVLFFRQAMKDNLIHTPFIYIKSDTTDFNLFLTQEDYSKFSGYNYDVLEQQHKKVHIRPT